MFRPAKRSLKGDGTAACGCLKSKYKDDRAKLFLVVPEDITRGNGHTRQMGRFRLAIRKTFSTRCSREVMVTPSLEAFHNLAR